MRNQLSLRVALLASFVAATACGGKSSVDRELAGLIPADTVAVARIASIDELERHARDVATAFGESTEHIDAGEWLQQLGGLAGRTELIDRRRPIVLAVSLPRGGQPAPVVLVPTTDAAAWVASLPKLRAEPVVAGSWVAVPLGAKYEKPSTPSTAMDGLPVSVFAARADVEKLAATFGPFLAMGLKEFETRMARELANETSGMNGEAIAETYVGAARAMLEAAKTLEVSIDYREGRLDAFAALAVKPGSDMDGWGSAAPIDLASVSRRVSGKGSVEVVMAADWQKLWPRYEAVWTAMLDMYPPQTRELMRAMTAEWMSTYMALGPVVAMEGDLFGTDGMTLTAHMSSPDAAAVASLFEGVRSKETFAKAGVSIAAPNTAEIGGASVRDYAMNVDVAKFAAMFGGNAPSAVGPSVESVLRVLFGKDHLPMRLATKGERTMLVLGKQSDSAAALAALDRTGGAWSKPVQQALARVADCNPLLVERLDVAAIMSAMARLAREIGGTSAMPAPAAGLSADVVVSGGIRGNEWCAGFAMDVAGFARVFRSTMPR